MWHARQDVTARLSVNKSTTSQLNHKFQQTGSVKDNPRSGQLYLKMHTLVNWNRVFMLYESRFLFQTVDGYGGD